jgi:sugar O-acyltransferase (sialic acid O-acetyltransferase NeuD family)
MQPILVFGAGGHAKVILDIVERQGLYRVIGLIDRSERVGLSLWNYQVLGDERILATIAPQVYGGIVAIGDNSIRADITERILKVAPGFEFATAIHPSAQIGRDVSIGAGTVVMANVVINPGTAVGRGVIVNTGAIVDHDNVIGNFASLGPGVTTGGTVRINDFSAISLGAKIIHGRTIGEHAVLGAGATAVDDIPARCIAYGTPAKVIRAREPGDRYL